MSRAIFMASGIFFLLCACLFGAAETLAWPMAWAVLGLNLASKVAGFVFAALDLIKERAKPGSGVDPVDRLISAIGYPGLYPGSFQMAGLDAVRLGPALHFPDVVRLSVLLVFAIGYSMATWAMLCIPFFSTFVRIQADRGQRVISSGPYGQVRHPGYAGVLLAHLALPAALDSIWVYVPAVLGAAFFVRRTAREDRTLIDHLDGYREYRTRIHWRLLPGVW